MDGSCGFDIDSSLLVLVHAIREGDFLCAEVLV